VRRLVLICLLALAVPATALALPHDKGDGTLVVRNASGKVSVLGAKGSVLGHVDKGQVYVYDWNPFDGKAPEVYGADKSVQRSPQLTVYSGTGIRFRFFGARSYSLRIVGSGIDVAAVGQGRVQLSGAGTLDDGQYSIDGADFANMPSVLFSGTFGQVTAPALGG
jgi:hypothetical protein